MSGIPKIANIIEKLDPTKRIQPVDHQQIDEHENSGEHAGFSKKLEFPEEISKQTIGAILNYINIFNRDGTFSNFY